MSPGPEAGPLLRVVGLRMWYETARGTVKAVDGVDLDLDRGETAALVGESGSGKTACGLSILRLIRPPGSIRAGEIRFDGSDLLRLRESEMRAIRGSRIAMVFQEPSLAFDPTMSIGAQIVETLREHTPITSAAAWTRAVALLGSVEIADAARRARAFAHEFSGGMLQRAMIAVAISCEPELLIADEPTTSLDTTTQAQILELLRGLADRLGMAMLLITHNFGIVARYARRAYVMHEGVVVDAGAVGDLFRDPTHDYTRTLWMAARRFEEARA